MSLVKKSRVNIAEFPSSLELAEVKACYKTNRSVVSFDRIRSSRDAFNVLSLLFNKDTIEYKEEFFLLLLNRSHNLLGWVKISEGGTTGTVVDSKIIFALALQTNAHNFIVAHNHPSGNLNPSKADIDITKKLVEGGRLLDINLLDHLIITPDGKYSSMADEGLM